MGEKRVDEEMKGAEKVLGFVCRRQKSDIEIKCAVMSLIEEGPCVFFTWNLECPTNL